ncbi:unnamed protein product [Oppiella nova]|uniref:Uncharacterized protein n=1 Tax=Oppiella nova TaxID=334625 RepID=A0A7R9MPC3_9ACAR|nr:unnamed protein product [Oppiella nova]CAG2180719.1 unnamed protein product [Oppiella nova]
MQAKDQNLRDIRIEAQV